MMQLTLNVPEQHDLKDPTVELDPQRLQNWLNDLPLMNRAEASYQLMHALASLNEQKIDSRKRFRLLNLYQSVVRKLYEADAADSLGQQRGTSQSRQLMADNLERLFLVMADGYKLVIKAWFAEGIQQSDAALFARGLRRAFRQLAWAMLHNYRVSRPQSEYLFFEMHQLYRLARHFGLQSVTDVSRNRKASASLADYYHAAMLASLLQPHLDTTQLERAFRALLHYGNTINIAIGNSWLDNVQHQYLIDLMSDTPPQNCTGLSSPARGEELYIMDLSGLIDSLHQSLASRSPEARFTGIEGVLLKALAPV